MLILESRFRPPTGQFYSLFSLSYRGIIGTGICIFSRYPILQTFMYPYAVSGYPYAVAHGDWFGGKGACFALIDHPIMKIHFFTSHVSSISSAY